MPRINELTNMSFDEVSLVDVPANQHANIVIAKRATKEETVPEIYDEDGYAIDVDDLEEGDVIVDEDGNEYEWVIDEEFADEPELISVGKSYTFADQVREELSKALDSTDRDALIAKAADEIAAADYRANQAVEIAKAERDLRLEREYVEVAKQYYVPIDEDELGPVLKRCAENLSYEDCAVIHKALSSAGEMIYAEVGVQGSGSNNDIFNEVDYFAEEAVSKAFGNDEEISKAEAIEKIFELNPAAYDEYLATRYSR
jgi:hypothetical protein